MDAFATADIRVSNWIIDKEIDQVSMLNENRSVICAVTKQFVFSAANDERRATLQSKHVRAAFFSLRSFACGD